MNDTELDDLLNVWKTPSPSESLRASLSAAIAAKSARPPRKFFTRWRLAAVAAVALFAVIVVNPNAFSAKAPAYTVDSEVIHHEEWNYPAGWKRVLMTSYNKEGSEVLLDWSFPDNPAATVALKNRLTTNRALEKLSSPFKKIAKYYYILKYDLKTPPDPSDEPDASALAFLGYPERSETIGRRDELLKSGCRGAAKVVGQDVILSYRTIIIQRPLGGGRLTLWMAPELGCFGLRAQIHELQPDGSWKLMSEKKALKVNVNR
jgi:hypothetical protein